MNRYTVRKIGTHGYGGYEIPQIHISINSSENAGAVYALIVVFYCIKYSKMLDKLVY